ncbi:MAG: hypothetical protein KAX80_05525 [Planctomycetes bacterium]|nr:hypothetical protein [Planctomycetota bacterium]
MTTLITAYNKSGCIGRCDAKCYNAKGAVCRCICGGKNHGVGLQRAIANLGAIKIESYGKWLDSKGPVQRPVMFKKQLPFADGPKAQVAVALE